MRPVFLLESDSNLIDAIEALDGYGIGFLVLVDESGRLSGVMTDGDLRRAILKREDNLHSIINKSPVTMPFDTPHKEIVRQLKNLHRRHMPLVDKDNIFFDVFTLDEIDFAHKENKVVIMAGGLGKRLGELTKDIPKPMLYVGDRPMLQHVIELFRDQGFNHFLICVNYKKEVIQEYFGTGARLGVVIDYVVEETQLGTAGALSLISEDVLLAPFFVVNGDVLTSVDFSEVLRTHAAANCVATMCIRPWEFQVPYGVVECDIGMRITGIEEKPCLRFDVSAGIYVLNPIVLKCLTQNYYLDMPMLFERIISTGLYCSAYRLNDYWVDIGREEDLAQANCDVSVTDF